jgi:hypothetical protein
LQRLHLDGRIRQQIYEQAAGDASVCESLRHNMCGRATQKQDPGGPAKNEDPDDEERASAKQSEGEINRNFKTNLNHS